MLVDSDNVDNSQDDMDSSTESHEQEIDGEAVETTEDDTTNTHDEPEIRVTVEGKMLYFYEIHTHPSECNTNVIVEESIKTTKVIPSIPE